MVQLTFFGLHLGLDGAWAWRWRSRRSIAPGYFLIWLAAAALVTGPCGGGRCRWGCTAEVLLFAVLCALALGRRKALGCCGNPGRARTPMLNDRGGQLVGPDRGRHPCDRGRPEGNGRVRHGDTEWLARGPDCAARHAHARDRGGGHGAGRRAPALNVRPVVACRRRRACPHIPPAAGPVRPSGGDPRRPDKLDLTDAEWRARLSPEQYHVLPRQGRHRAGLHRQDTSATS